MRWNRPGQEEEVAEEAVQADAPGRDDGGLEAREKDCKRLSIACLNGVN
jgi:hypothetical protein